MFNKRKEFERSVKARLDNIEKRLDRLECEHKNTKLVYSFEYDSTSISRHVGFLVCDDCGKVLDKFRDREDFLKAKLEKAKDEVKYITYHLNRIKKENSDE